MNDESQVFTDGSVNEVTEDTGVVDERSTLSLDLDDKALIGNFKRWISDSQAYWDGRKGYNLKYVRNKNERYLLGQQIDKSELYDYQVPFIDNQIYVGIQSILAYVSANTPSCEVVPEDDTTQSLVIAQDLETAINIHCEKFKLSDKVKAVARSIYVNRVGILKLKYDDITKDVIPVVVDPRRVILDKDCRQGENPTFVCEICTDSVATLLRKFPEKESEIMRELGRERKTNKLLNEVVAYNEIWFTDQSAIALWSIF